MSREQLHAFLFFFFLNDPAPTEIYPLPLPDALPISQKIQHLGNRREPLLSGKQSRLRKPVRGALADLRRRVVGQDVEQRIDCGMVAQHRDRKSTRLNSSHGYISYAVFCLNKKKTIYDITM